MKIEEIQARSILVPSKLPDADFVANPYVGCQFGCLYCYASFMGRFHDEAIDNWGNYVYVKVNAPQLLSDQLERWSSSKRQASVLLSSVTDPYHGIEAKYRLVEAMLRVFVAHRYPGLIGVLTKSALVTRDIDLLRSLPRCEVGLTVTTTDDKLSRFLEVRAPSATRRLKTLATLAAAGLETYAFVGPLLPHFRAQPGALDELFRALAQSGVRSVYVEHLNLKRYIKDRLWETLASEPVTTQQVYRGASTEEHRAALADIVQGLLDKHGLQLRMAKVLHHETDASSLIPLRVPKPPSKSRTKHSPR